MFSNYQAVRRASKALLMGRVLHADDVTAGNGSVVDWRTVRSGETLTTGADAFDTAQLFVALVGEQSALDAVNSSPLDLPTRETFVPGAAERFRATRDHVFGCRKIHCRICGGAS